MHGAAQPSTPVTVVGRYAIYQAIASGGMATVHLGRLVGPGGFSRTVAIKRLHPQLAHDPELAPMLLDEARLAARIQHHNVVPTLDVVVADEEMLLVMEYVRGDSLSRLLQAARVTNCPLPPNVVVAIVSHALAGLHAAHEAKDERGQPLELVHRDVSPQNIMVGSDGISRVLDFGIAKATGRVAQTRGGEVKGKVAYMSKEQLSGSPVTRTADIYAAGIVLHEALTNTRMFAADSDMATVARIVANDIRVPSQIDPALAPFDRIVRRAVMGSPEQRFATALEMARELEAICAPASATIVGDWVQNLAGERLDMRERLVAEIERSSTHQRSALAVHSEDNPTGPRAPTSGVVATRVQQPSVPSFVGPPPPQALPPVAPAERSPATTIALAVMVGLLLAGVGLGIVALRHRSAKAAASSAAADGTGTSAIEPLEPAAATPSLENVTEAAPTPSVVAPSPSAAKAVHVRPSCDPPYTLDSKGHKHFIPECVR